MWACPMWYIGAFIMLSIRGRSSFVFLVQSNNTINFKDLKRNINESLCHKKIAKLNSSQTSPYS